MKASILTNKQDATILSLKLHNLADLNASVRVTQCSLEMASGDKVQSVQWMHFASHSSFYEGVHINKQTICCPSKLKTV